MFWMQWSRSAGLFSGPFLSMMRMQASCVRIVIFLMSSADLPTFFNAEWIVIAASTAVCEWNSAGNEILNSTFSITFLPYGRGGGGGGPGGSAAGGPRGGAGGAD